MSFLNTFIELSILNETEAQSAQLQYHNKLLSHQNDLIQAQTEGINSLIRHNQQQDWIRDYIYRINKLCEQLESTPAKDSLQYYYSIYCLAKGVNDIGVTTSAISELRDKEYFDNCLDRIGKLLFDFIQEHKEKISEYNEHIKNIEEAPILDKLIECEKAKLNIHMINESIHKYHKNAVKSTFIFGSICSVIFLILFIIYGSKGELLIKLFLSIFLSIPLGFIFYYKKTDGSKNFNKLNNQIESLKTMISDNPECYDYAEKVFKYYDFSIIENTSQEILSALEKRKEEIKTSLAYCNNSATEIFKTFHCNE